VALASGYGRRIYGYYVSGQSTTRFERTRTDSQRDPAPAEVLLITQIPVDRNHCIEPGVGQSKQFPVFFPRPSRFLHGWAVETAGRQRLFQRLGTPSSISTFIPDAPSGCPVPLPASQSLPRASGLDTAPEARPDFRRLPENPSSLERNRVPRNTGSPLGTGFSQSRLPRIETAELTARACSPVIPYRVGCRTRNALSRVIGSVLAVVSRPAGTSKLTCMRLVCLLWGGSRSIRWRCPLKRVLIPRPKIAVQKPAG
jgi:hypothetical protein